MRIFDILSRYLDGVHEVIDVCHSDVDLRRHLRLPEGVTYRRCGLDEAEKLDLGRGSLVLCLLGPNPVHNDPDALAPVLRSLRPGARAVLLFGWPLTELPYHRLLGPLVDGSCQVLEAVPLDRVSVRGVDGALIVECVAKLAPLRSYLTDIRPDSAPDTTAAPDTVDELRTVLRLANEFVLADLVARPMRQRLTELTKQVEELTRLLAATKSSKIRRAVAKRVRHPVQAFVEAPRDVARVLRFGKSRKAPGSGSTVH